MGDEDGTKTCSAHRSTTKRWRLCPYPRESQPRHCRSTELEQSSSLINLCGVSKRWVAGACFSFEIVNVLSGLILPKRSPFNRANIVIYLFPLSRVMQTRPDCKRRVDHTSPLGIIGTALCRGLLLYSPPFLFLIILKLHIQCTQRGCQNRNHP